MNQRPDQLSGDQQTTNDFLNLGFKDLKKSLQQFVRATQSEYLNLRRLENFLKSNVMKYRQPVFVCLSDCWKML